MTLRRFTGLTAAAASAVLAATALAASATDPKDAGPKLDIKLVAATVKSGLVTVKVGIYGAFSPTDLGQGKLTVLFDSNQDGTIDFRARIVSANGGPITARLSGHGSQFEPLPVKRTGSTLSMTFPTDVVSVAGKKLRVAATSTYQTKVDRAPNTGWVNAG